MSDPTKDIDMTDTVAERIQSDIDRDPVVLFMKGTPVFPQCGFSAQVVQVLSLMGVKFQAHDVLADDELRQGIKEFSSWPTIPQLYVKGEFVGGCDIVREMYQTGELAQLFQDKGIECQVAA
jgi:monothiol glutaredoxin